VLVEQTFGSWMGGWTLKEVREQLELSTGLRKPAQFPAYTTSGGATRHSEAYTIHHASAPILHLVIATSQSANPMVLVKRL
jgi:hypothetical protein